MKRNWTPAQTDAINAQGGAVIVSAAAGSGKTAVLVERVLSRITNPASRVDIDKLLVVTYTNAAAAEMKERISAGLERLSKEFPQDSYYRRQLMLLPSANISTIHSFCGNVIKENFYLLGDVPSDYKIADESRLSIIRDRAAENIIEEIYSSDDEGYRYMADCFSTAKGEYNLKSTILDIYNFLCSQPFPEKWMDDVERAYCCDSASESIWGRAILEEAALAADFFTRKTDECIALFNSKPELGKAFGEKISGSYKSLVDKFSSLVSAGDWNGLYEFAHTQHSFERLSAAKGYSDDPVKVRISNILKMIKKEITDSIPKLFIYDDEEYLNSTKIARPAIKALFKAVRLFSEEYSRLKLEESYADFSDLERWTLRLLYKDGSRTPLAIKLSEKFCEVMVDEYQDANELQDTIFNCLSDNGKKLFVVGDVKQSIYRFRQANPELFLKRKNSYAPYDRKIDNYPAKIMLDKNFRSRSGITAAVNFIFSKLMSPQAGDMYYKSEDMLVAAADYSEDDKPDTSLDIIFAPISMNIASHIAEARLIAKRISELKSSLMIEENGVKRPARYGDFAILLRNGTNALEYMNVLKNSGIPARCSAGDNFLKTNEILIMISLLQVINNPLLDIPLLNVMTSPIFAFTPTELAKIRIERKKEPLYASVKRCADSGDSHCGNLCDLLSYFRMTASSVSLSELISDIFDKTSYPEIISATDGGDIKLNNLRLFYKKSIEYSDSGGCLSSYVRYLDKLCEQDAKIKTSQINAESSKVEIMTIHRSKGLEFPVCFVAGISSPNQNDAEQLVIHPKLGVGAAINVITGPYKIESLQKQAIKMKQSIDEVSEELRVLYVALTRAKEKLFMVVSTKSGKPGEMTAQLASRLEIKNESIHPYVVRSLSSNAQRLIACAILYGRSKELLEYIDVPTKPFIGNAEDYWNVSLHMANELLPVDIDSETRESREYDITAREIERRLALEYKNGSLANMPVKVSVSELAHEELGRSFSFSSRPAFLSKDNLTGAQRGTAVHTLMQFADYARFIDTPQQELDRLVRERYISPQQAAAIDVNMILNCLNTPIMQSYINSEKSYREYRFAVKIKAKDVFDSLPADTTEDIVLQGAVDCAFVENGEIIIVDYKTDKVRSMQELKDRYSEQLRLYSFAMQLSTGMKVRERVIYSFALNDTITV